MRPVPRAGCMGCIPSSKIGRGTAAAARVVGAPRLYRFDLSMCIDSRRENFESCVPAIWMEEGNRGRKHLSSMNWESHGFNDGERTIFFHHHHHRICVVYFADTGRTGITFVPWWFVDSPCACPRVDSSDAVFRNLYQRRGHESQRTM